MARIALAVGFGVLGALTGGLGWFGIAPTLAHALAGGPSQPYDSGNLICMEGRGTDDSTPKH